MNENHAICGSPEWRALVRDVLIPEALGNGSLGDDAIEIGPGFGATTEVLRTRVGRLVAVEIDPQLAADLRARMEGTNVEVVEGDAGQMAFPDARFTGAACFSMLHHVPSAALQDALFREVARVLRAGALFIAADSLASPELEAFHEGDTYVPVEPAGLQQRLESCGFTDVTVTTSAIGWSARSRRASTIR